MTIRFSGFYYSAIPSRFRNPPPPPAVQTSNKRKYGFMFDIRQRTKSHFKRRWGLHANDSGEFVTRFYGTPYLVTVTPGEFGYIIVTQPDNGTIRGIVPKQTAQFWQYSKRSPVHGKRTYGP